MNSVLRVTIVDPNDDTRESLKGMLLGMDQVWLEAECSRYEFFADVVSQTQPDIGVVMIDQDVERGIKLISEVREASAKCQILVVSNSNDGNLILRVMRAGAREFLTQPIRIEDLVAALERIGSQYLGRTGSGTQGAKVICVAGATGGVGTTSVAVNLGCYLAREEKRNAVLVDLDLCLGDADVFLDTIPEYTLVDVAQNVTRLDFTLLKRSLTKHSSKLFLLPRPVQLEDVDLITAEDISRVIGLLKATFSHLIVDISKSYNAIDLTALRMADDILLVTQLDLPCLRNVVRLVTSFGDMEGMLDKVRIVVNRVGLDQGHISLKKAQDTIGRDIFWQLPNDYRVMVQSRNNGIPLIEQAPKAAIAQSMQLLADAVSGDEAAATAAIAANEKLSFGKLLNFLPIKAGKKEGG